MSNDQERQRIDEDRPTAEQMLERIRREERQTQRGRLRVFLGAAPGVGKTYAMLEEGHRLRDTGSDVVVGFVETYGRAETEAQIGDLEIIPRKRIPYRGVVLEEMDTDAVLVRRPEIALVDELAHTNAPDSPRTKRYHDVELLLSAGIDVLSTMNIQHLDGLNDLIQDVTGIKVRETVPDRILDDADVELVDLPPVLLRERLEAGKIYPQQQATQALQNFFRESNLTALRELALRRTAEGVETMLEGMMRGDQVSGPWPTIERVMACLNHHADAESIVRHAWRMARGLHADLVAVSVTERPIDELPIDQRRALEHHLQLAEDLGALVITVIDHDAARGISKIARSRHVTDIVVGRSQRARWRSFPRTSVLDRLLAELDDVDIHVVGRSREHTSS